MNTQNILKYYGTRLDVRLDSSEFYDYEVSKTQTDYNTEVLDLSRPITYETLKISDSLANFACQRNTITLTEYDNRVNDPNYEYSGFSTTVGFSNFVQSIELNHEYLLLNNNVYLFMDSNEVVHYMQITSFNHPLHVDTSMGVNEADILSGFTGEYYKCTGKLEKTTACCGITPKYGVKPWAYQFIQPEQNDCQETIIQRRTEKGWTLDFVFNRESEPWSAGGKFYFFGTGGYGDVADYADSAFSLGFTSDRRVSWVATRYSGHCDPENGYVEGFYTESGVTPRLCTTGDTKDFNITVVFERYKELTGCDIENMGGWNDLLGYKVNPYQDTEVTAVTSTQITTYTETDEELGKKWAEERERRLGVLKIYLNGRPIYKKDDFEEIVPSSRGQLPFIQSWGGSQNGDINHTGVCCFNIKSIKYYEEPLDFVHVRHNFLTRLNQYDFFICGADCEDDPIGYVTNGLLTENGEIIITEDNNITLY